MAAEAATSRHHHQQQQQQRQNLQPSHHLKAAVLDSLKQLFLIRRKDEEAAAAPAHHHDQKLPPPYSLIKFSWGSHECGDACQKSKEALNDLKPSWGSIKDLSDKNLFLVHIETGKTTEYVSYSRGGHAWGSNDIMVNLRGDTTLDQRIAYLKCAANLRGGAVHLLHLKVLTPEEQSAWLKALSLAALRNAAPKSLLISKCDLDIYHVLSALKKSNGLDHLSLQWMRINDPCIEVLRDFSSLTSLHLEGIDVSGKFVAQLAELRPSHLSLAASVQRLHIDSISIDWGKSIGFLHNWPKLQELSLSSYTRDMREEELINFMAHLASPFIGEHTSGSDSASPLQLYSLDMQRNSIDSPHLGYSSAELSQSAVAAVVDALARSGLPFFQHPKMGPAIETQLWRNQRNHMPRSGLELVPATSMPLVICGDPFSGKTTLVSTMLSIYERMPFRTRRKRRISSFRARPRGIKVRTTHPPCIPSMRNKARDILIRTGSQADDPIQRIAVRAIEREGIRLSLWDIQGQQQFPAFQDCMFPDMPSLWVFVWSPAVSANSDRGPMKTMAEFEASFRYWLRFLTSKRRQSNITLKVMVVFTRADQIVSVSSRLSPCINSLRSDFDGVIDIVDPPFEVDARQENSVKPVAEHFFKVAKEMLQGVKVYNIFTQVGKQLSKHLKNKNERITTWNKFTKICKMGKHASLNASVNLNTIASTLSESGSIIYTSENTPIVLDPNLFYNHIIASLIRVTKSEPFKDTLVFNNGCVAREFLEGNLESTIGFKVEGSLVLRLMEAMHLCCKVDIDHAVSRNNVDLIFIPAILANVGMEQLQWASSSATCNLDDNDTFVYRGRRLECENKDLTFLTPGIFPRIQILFNNAFQSNANIMLGKDSISIRFPNKEIIVVLCQAKSNYVIDVLVRGVNNTELEDMPRTLAYMEKHIIDSLITILAQPTGIQGVKLIESVIRPECLFDPSRAQDREDQCMQITYLKEQLREKLERGELECYDWNSRNTDMLCPPTNYDLIDLLGFENYWGVIISCKAWLELLSGDELLKNDEDNILEQSQSNQNWTMTSLKNNMAQEHQILEDVIEVRCSKFMVRVESEEAIEVQSSQFMGKAISNLHVTKNEILEVEERLSQIHENLQCVRKDVMTKIKKCIGKLLKLPMENEYAMQLPSVAILTTNGDNGIVNPVTSLSGVTSVTIQLYCEDHILPHPVQNQPGISLTSWSTYQSQCLSKALPYINGLFYVLSVAIIMGIDSVDPLPNPFKTDWTRHRQLAKQYPLLSSTIESIKDISSSSTISPECPSMIEAFNEWQKWLTSVLVENGGLTDQNITDKFCLRRAICDDKIGGSSQVTWLCEAHHEMRSRKDAEAESLQPHNHQKLQRSFSHEIKEPFERPVRPAENLSVSHYSNLLPPHRLICTRLERYEIAEACEESRASVDSLKPLSITLEGISDHHELGQQLSERINAENLFLISKRKLGNHGIVYWSYADSNGSGERAWAWGSTDMMLNLGDAEQQQRMAILTAAANLTGGALHLLLNLHYNLTKEEEKAWVEELSLAAHRDEGPSSLLIQAPEFRDAHGLLNALKKNKRLKHLSFQRMKIGDECIEVLGDFTSLTTLHLHDVKVSEEFVGKLAELHPSRSPFAASLQSLHINHLPIDWRRSTGFLRHWPHLKELSLDGSPRMKEEELMDFMDHLAPPKKEEAETVGNILPSFPPQLYSLQLGIITRDLSGPATATVMDALARTGLPFFEIKGLHRKNPTIEAQLWRNQRNFMLGSDLRRVPATSIRLFISGDPFAGKTTLVSTMCSMYGRKRDRLRFMFTGIFTGERTKGIEVHAIKKDGIRVSVWDMAGQQQFHAFHDSMFRNIGTSLYNVPSMFVFVWSPMDSQSSHRGAEKRIQDFEASFRYWLKFLASKSPQSIIPLKVIVVFTRADQMEFVSGALSPSIDALRYEFEEVIDIVNPPFEVDARKKNSVKPLVEHIFNIAKGVLQGIELYDICTKVSKNLLKYSKNTNKRIITWEEFSKICNIDDKAKLNAIAMSLNESGNIIYINRIKYIIPDPNWFCNEIMGSLIDFPNSKGSSTGTIVFDKGCIPRDFLEERFEVITKSEVKGSLLVELMEAMHLCCKVPKRYADLIFIPAILPYVGVNQLQWTPRDDNVTFVYMGRRLECENKDLTCFTPGLFPRIQVLFSNAFQSKNDNVVITLGKDFISICFPKSEIIVMFRQSESNHVMDVLIRAQNNTQQCMQSTLAFVGKIIINNLTTICAQPTGVQGVKLIESVIRPDCLLYPSMVLGREDQCIKVTYLKNALRKKLEGGKKESYDWKQTRDMSYPLSNDLIDLLGLELYGEVLKSYKKWFEVEVRDALLEIDEIVDESRKYRSRENVIMTSLENDLVKEDQLTLEEARDVQSSKVMVRLLLVFHHKMDQLQDKMDQINKELGKMHKDLQYKRIDVMGKVEKSITKLLKIALENEAKNQLPRVALLTTNSSKPAIELLRWVPELLGGKSMRIQLYCEDKKLPHPVENQPGIILTSLSESQSECLDKALPYINGLFHVLTIAARLGISSTIPFASSLFLDWTSHLKLAKQYLMIQGNIEPKKDIYDLSTLECASKEWQRCLASILRENGGLTDQNIAKKFHLKRTIYDEGEGSAHVAWLCNVHSEGKKLVPLG